MNAELVQLDSSAQISLELQAFDSTGVHRMVEYLAASLTSALGSIHRDLSIPEEVLRLHSSVAAESNPNTYGEHNLVPVRIKRNN
jgi:hypothetical protein